MRLLGGGVRVARLKPGAFNRLEIIHLQVTITHDIEKALATAHDVIFMLLNSDVSRAIQYS